MHQPKIGFVTCVHPFYELPAVLEHRDRAVGELKAAGCEVVAAQVPRTPVDAVELAAKLRASDVDMIVLFFCTWVAEEITLALARELMDIPLLLWALPYLDRDIPMPSPISGLTASGSNIRRLGKPFVHMVGHVTPAKVAEAAGTARVAAVVRSLRRARFGVVGDPCPGMLDVGVDDAVLQKALGITTVHRDLDELLKLAQAAPPEQAARAARKLIGETGGLRDLDEETLADNLRLYVAMKELVEANKLDAYCVRCWPELRDRHKLTMCATHSLMSQLGVPSSCEVDLPALITTYILSKLAGAPAFNFDATAYLEQEDAIQIAHCGAADPALAADPSQVLLRRHMRTGTGATVEFPFPAGPATLAKLLRPVNGSLKLFAARGKVVSSEGSRGSVATLRPEPSAAAFLDKMLREPVEHHVALVYGNWTRALATFCDFTGVEFRPLSR